MNLPGSENNSDEAFWAEIKKIPANIRKEVLKSRKPPIVFVKCHTGEGPNRSIYSVLLFGKNKKRKEDDTYIWEDTQNTKVVRAHGGLNISAAFAFYLVAKKKIKVFLLDGRKKTKPEANNALFRMELPVPLED